jgi:hypothetical protein
VVSEIEELCESLGMVWNLLFKCRIDLSKMRICEISFGVEGIKEVRNTMDRMELLFTATCLVLFVNAFLARSRLCL